MNIRKVEEFLLYSQLQITVIKWEIKVLLSDLMEKTLKPK